MIIVNGWKPLTIITKHSILDTAAALDPPLIYIMYPSCISYTEAYLESYQTYTLEHFCEKKLMTLLYFIETGT